MAWALGQRFVQGTGTDTRPSEFTSMWTYDGNKRAYRSWFFNSYGDAPDWSGQWKEDSQSFVMAGDFGGGFTGTLTAHFVDKDTVEWHADTKDGDGKVTFVFDGKWTRHK